MTDFEDDQLQNELRRKVEYERWVLPRFLRGDVDEISIQNRVACEQTGKDGALNETLKIRASSTAYLSNQLSDFVEELLPVVFVTAFKMHDMIGVWLLEQNGIKTDSLGYGGKAEQLLQIPGADGTTEPSVFANATSRSRAFWKLYDELRLFRNELIHDDGYEHLPGGRLRIEETRCDKSVRLDEQVVHSYLFVLCKISDVLTGDEADSEVVRHRIDQGLSALSAIHQVERLPRENEVLYKVDLTIADDAICSKNPFEATIDPRAVQARLARRHDADAKIRFTLEVEYEREAELLQWSFPLDEVPDAPFELAESDAAYDGFRES